MRVIDAATLDTWQSGAYIGDQRAMTRVTVQAIEGRESSFRSQVYFSVRWGQLAKPREVPNVRSVSWNRRVGTPVSEATITMWNAKPLRIGELPEWDLDRRGHYTPFRGDADFSDRWGDLPNPWHKVLQEDRLIRVYQGYGWDESLPPELDPHMYLMFTGLISEVVPTAGGLITLSCHDLARELNDEIAAPPVVPHKRYPKQLRFEQRKTTTKTVQTEDPTKWVHPTYQSDSGIPYNGFNGSIYGHRPSYAFDGDTTSYWLSIGNDRPGADYAFEYVQGHMGGKEINSVRADVWGGPYKCYLSIKEDGIWQGKHEIPYNEDSSVAAPNGANIRFVKDFHVDHEDSFTVHLPRTYRADSVRLTFTDLSNSHLGPFPYRAGVRNFRVGLMDTTNETVSTTTGNYDDYTDIVKLLLAYGGFHWPRNKMSTDIYSDGSKHLIEPVADDSVLQKWVKDDYTGRVGRIWGDFENAGTFGPAPLDITIFDKKPLMDGITYIADILNFLFTVDEDGAAIWRSPNIWQVGNVIANPADGRSRTTDVHVFDERTVITDLTVTRSSANKREKVLVASVDGKYGAVAHPTKYPGYGVNSKLRRVSIWTDTHFTSNKECQIMADLIGVRQLWTRRTDRVVIVGTPAVQIDDQARIYEHTTNEGYLHYIQGIQSDWSAEDGKWLMTLDTNWLGETPFSNWVFDPTQLHPDTQDYLSSIGKI